MAFIHGFYVTEANSDRRIASCFVTRFENGAPVQRLMVNSCYVVNDDGDILDQSRVAVDIDTGEKDYNVDVPYYPEY